jgi:hypothetical protein
MSSDPDKMMSKADKMTKLTLTRWSADWRGATELYEQAANGFRASNKYEKAKVALEKASKGQEMQASYPNFPLKIIICCCLFLSHRHSILFNVILDSK